MVYIFFLWLEVGNGVYSLDGIEEVWMFWIVVVVLIGCIGNGLGFGCVGCLIVVGVNLW